MIKVLTSILAGFFIILLFIIIIFQIIKEKQPLESKQILGIHP